MSILGLCEKKKITRPQNRRLIIIFSSTTCRVTWQLFRVNMWIVDTSYVIYYNIYCAWARLCFVCGRRDLSVQTTDVWNSHWCSSNTQQAVSKTRVMFVCIYFKCIYIYRIRYRRVSCDVVRAPKSNSEADWWNTRRSSSLSVQRHWCDYYYYYNYYYHYYYFFYTTLYCTVEFTA